jgi:alpha-ribazole phosphatase
MKKTVLLFRHGQPEGPDCCKGSGLDCDLSPEGERQTQRNVNIAMFAARHSLRSTLVVSSPLKRARRFSEVWRERVDQYGLPPSAHLITPEFTDIGVGEWEGKPWGDIENEYPDQFPLIPMNAERLQLPRGEDMGVFIRRIRGVWRRILEIPCEYVVMVGHSANNEVILADAQGKKNLNFKSQGLGCVNKIVIDDDGSATVLMHNITSHHESSSTTCAAG